MKIVGNIVAYPDARFTPDGEYRVYFDVRVTDDVTVSCVMRDMIGESFLNALPGVDGIVVGLRVAIRGVPTVRRYRSVDGQQRTHSYINVTELVCKLRGEAMRFSNDL